MAPAPTTSTFWSRAWQRNLPKLDHWFDHSCYFLMQMASVTFGYAVFRFLRVVGVTASFVDLLETLDKIGIVCVFARFIFDIVRLALSPAETA
jgi:hypothetical protein